MVLGLTYGYDSDDDASRRSRGYAGTVVATSLDSDVSFRMPSPTRLSTTESKKREPSSHVREKAAKNISPDSSLEELIDSFRASASSFKLSSARDVQPLHSPETTQGRSSPSKGTQWRDVRLNASTGRRPDELIGLSPMPKLTYVPKQKPSLSIRAPKKSTLTSKLKPPTKVQLPASTRKLHHTNIESPKKPSKSSYKTPSPQSSSPSNQSTKSSVLDEIEAPDSDDAGEISVDDLISRDIRQLRQLVSSSQDQLFPPNQRYRNLSLTSEDVERGFRRNTRFRTHDDDEYALPFQYHSPSLRPSISTSSPLQPSQSLHDHHIKETNQNQEDSIMEELRAMKVALVNDKAKKKAEEDEAKKKAEDEQSRKDADAPGSGIASLREAVDTIDKNLLLALRPFEKMKQEQEKEEAKIAAAEEKAAELLDLPMATKNLVDQLEQAFGGLMRQREAELKAEEEAAAQAKASEEAKKKEEEDKKALDEAAQKRKEDEVLSLLPMRGKLMSTEGDIHDALERLEIAEMIARRSVGREPTSPDVHLFNLRDYATRRGREIEEMLMAPVGGPRAVDWHRSTFGVDPPEDSVREVHEPDSSPEHGEETYSQIVKTEVLEKLDFTILKLKHALSIDKKETDEAAAERSKADAEKAAQEKKILEEKNKQKQLEADAAAAKLRVMGMSSIDELHWVREADTNLYNTSPVDCAISRLESSFNTRRQNRATEDYSSFLNDRSAAERFDRLMMMMEAPSGYSNRQQEIWSGTNDTQQWNQHACDTGNQNDMSGPRAYTTRNEPGPVPRYSNEQLDHLFSRDVNYHSSPKRPTDRRNYNFTVPVRVSQSEKLMETKRAIHELQANRREKAHWFYRSTRLR